MRIGKIRQYNSRNEESEPHEKYSLCDQNFTETESGRQTASWQRRVPRHDENHCLTKIEWQSEQGDR